MNINSTYKTLFATVLFTVYFFIATPIQFWHHHNSSTNTEIVKASKEKAQITIVTTCQDGEEADCQVCSHQYSAYNAVLTVFVGSHVSQLQLNRASYLLSIPTSPHFEFSNKGPPQIA